ncbi:site-specific DNA-methyltransferase [Candidatus Heimdallarchaeota archaeon B3_Heim]|nr:MAG: site-specific DNA-methyltransferase [Candidatus Heimdallarchaeota archaeon B3_Heim]
MKHESNYKLVIGDVNHALPNMAKKRLFDLIIADPPFGISFSKSSHEYGADEYHLYNDDYTTNNYYEFSKKWILNCYNALSPTGSLYIISGWTNLQYILNALETTDFHMLNHAIWHFSWGVYTKRRFVTSHYHILLLVKNRKKYQFYKQKHYDEDVFFWQEYNRGNDPHRIKGHPCQLPIVLLEKLILTSSSVGDLVGDVFSGSGGTILAARKTERDVIGFELREEYKPIIEKKALFGKSLYKDYQKNTLDSYLETQE